MALADNEYYFVQSDPFGEGSTSFMKGTVTSTGFTAVVVSAEEAAPWLIDHALKGEGYPSFEGAQTLPAGSTAPAIASIQEAALADIGRQPSLSDDQRYQALHRTLGDNPTVVKVGFETFGADVAQRIWGNSAVDTATQNSTERASDPELSKLIQNSLSQGVGPVPRVGSGNSAGGGAGPDPKSGAQGGGSGAGTTNAPDTNGQGTASSPRADPRTGGDPLLLATGQLYLQVTDLEVRGRGVHFSFARTYLHQTSYRGPMGFSWDHSYNLWVREAVEIQPDGSFSNVVYRSTGQAREDRFVHVSETAGPPPGPLGTIADATFRGPPGYFDELTKAAGNYQLRMVNGTIIRYNDDLQVESIADGSGNALTFSYADGLLISIIDAVGKTFEIANDEYGRVVQIRDVTGNRRLGYAFDDIGNLVEADIFADASTAASTDYIYLGSDAPPGMDHNLIEVIGSDGNSALAVRYGVDGDWWSFNRVLEQRSQDGLFQYEYGSPEYVEDPHFGDQLNLPRSVTRVTYPNGHIVDHSFNGQGNVVLRREQINELAGALLAQALIAEYSYNREGLLTREQRPDGATISYEYDVDGFEDLNGSGTAEEASSVDRLGFGNLLRRTETPRSGSGETRTLITAWEFLPGGSRPLRQRGPFYADPTGVEVPGQAVPSIEYGYDAAERLIRIDYGNVEDADGVTQALPSSHFSYDTHGNLTDVHVGTIRTHYAYFPDLLRSGFRMLRVEDADGLARETRYEVDSLGRLILLRDSLNAETRWEYNGFDLVIQATLPALSGTSPEVRVAYDRARRIKQSTETILNSSGTPHADGPLVIHYRYDQSGRLIETTAGPMADPAQRQQRTTFTPSGQPQRMIDAVGTVSELNYDPRNLLWRVRFASGTTSQSEERLRYSRSGELSEVIDGLGHETKVERDGFGRVRRVTDRDGNAWETLYDAQDRAIRRRLIGPPPGASAAPIIWSECRQEFDAAGRIFRRTDVLFVPGDVSVPRRELVTEYFYDKLSRLVEVRDVGKTTNRFTYDGLGRLVQTEDADGNVVRNEYDDVSRRLTVVRAEKEMGSIPERFELFRTVVFFDNRGLAVQETDTVGNSTHRTYDSRGLVQEQKLADGRVSTYRYDLFGQLLEQTVQGGAISISARREYDAGGRLTALVSSKGERSEWSYDSRGRLAASSGPHGPRTYEYDAEGRTLSEHAPSGLRAINTYSAEGLLLTRAVDATSYQPLTAAPAYRPLPVPPLTLTYTPGGKLTRVDESGTLVRFDYDSLERVVREVSPGTMLTHGWDDAGRRTSLTYSDGRTIGYRYSPGGYLTEILQLARGTTYPGDPGAAAVRPLATIVRAGARPHRLTVPGMLHAAYSYDAARRLIGIDYLQGGVAIERLRVLHGGGGERLLDDRATSMRVFTYDPIGRLSRASDHPPAAPSINALSPAADEPGLIAVAQQSDIDALSQSTGAGAGPEERSFVYVLDPAGNRLSSTTVLIAGGTPEVVSYVPGPADQYVQVDGASTIYDRDGNLLSDGVRTFGYDVLGRLIRTTNGGATTVAAYDPLGRLAVLAAAANTLYRWAGSALIGIEQGAARVQLVPGDRINTPVHVAAGGRDLVPLVDDIGSITGWVGANGAMLGARQFDPFGRPLQKSGVDPAPLGFAGYILAPQTELYWLAARVYDSRLGRFLQPDPMGFIDGLNVYAFARNAPGTFIDTFGCNSNELDWGTVACNTIKTVGIGVAVVGISAAAVTAGIVSAPFVITVGVLAMVGVGMYSFIKRSDEAFAAGQTDPAGSAALAALGDTVGVTNIVEGATGQDAVTDRVLGTQERSERLGTGIGTVGTFVLGPKAARVGGAWGAPKNPMSLYSIPSISRPTYYNPLLTGKYISPEGVVWEGSVLRGSVRATTRSWRDAGSAQEFMSAWPENFRSNSAGGSYWHVRSHFGDMPGRGGAHSFFDPAFRENMVLLGDAPTIAARGGTVEIGDFSIGPDQSFPLRDVWPHSTARGSDAAYHSSYVFVEDPYPQIGTSGGQPSAAQSAGIPGRMPPAPPPGTPLNGGYRVIVRDGGEVGLVNMLTMYPE
jgi:RHS repeat-associated protein